MRLIFLAFLFLVSSASAFDPTKHPVNVIIPFAPGGGADEAFRHVQKFAAATGIVMVPIYKAGADGMIGVAALRDAQPDGRTLGVIPAATIAAYEVSNPDKSVTIVTGIKGGLGAYVARMDPKLSSLEDLTQLLRNGTEVKMGYGAPGQKMMLDQLLEFVPATTPPLMVPFKGGNPAILALLSGYIDIAWVPYSVVQPHVEAEKLRLLAVTGGKLDEYPHVPMLNSKFKGWQDLDGQGISAPPNLSAPALEFWTTFFNRYLAEPNTKNDFIQARTPILKPGPVPFRVIIDRSKVKLQKRA